MEYISPRFAPSLAATHLDFLVKCSGCLRPNRRRNRCAKGSLELFPLGGRSGISESAWRGHQRAPVRQYTRGGGNGGVSECGLGYRPRFGKQRPRASCHMYVGASNFGFGQATSDSYILLKLPWQLCDDPSLSCWQG